MSDQTQIKNSAPTAKELKKAIDELKTQIDFLKATHKEHTETLKQLKQEKQKLKKPKKAVTVDAGPIVDFEK